MIAVLFLAAAIAMGAYSVVTFFQHINDDLPLDIITSINDLCSGLAGRDIILARVEDVRRAICEGGR